MSRLNDLINEYNRLYGVSNVESVISVPEHTFSNSEQYHASNVNSVDECINTLKNNEMYIGGTFYNTTNNNCFLHDKNTSPSLVGGNGIALLRSSQYYNDKMADVFDQIKEALLNGVEPFSSMEYTNAVENLNNTGEIYNFINDKRNISFVTLQRSDVLFMKWIFGLLFVLAMIFQLFENMIFKTLSIVSFIGAIVVLLNILKIVNTFVFSIMLLSLFSAIVIVLFFKKMYIPSFVFLLFGAMGCNFYLNYKGL